MPTTQSDIEILEAIQTQLEKAAKLIKNPEKDDKTQDLLWDIYHNWCHINGNDFSDDMAIDIITMHTDLAEYDAEERKQYAKNLRSYADNEVDDKIQELEDEVSATSSEEESESENDNSSDEEDDDEKDIKTATITSSKTGQLRQRLSDQFEGFADSKEATAKEWHRTQRTEQRFFDIRRNSKPVAQRLSDSFLFNRQTKGETRIIDTNDISARSLITADTAAVARSIANVDLKQIKTVDDISNRFGWNKKGKVNNWNRETIMRGSKIVSKQKRDIHVKAQFQPTTVNYSNLKVDGVGRYGTGAADNKLPNILEVINRITDQKPANEKKLAALLIKFSRFGSGFTPAILKAEGFTLDKPKAKSDQQVEQLNRLAYLVCIKEISRRKHQGMKDGKYIEELPFGIAVTRTLQLLADGHLRMQQVFEANSLYGVFTGNEIMLERNLPATKQKFNNIFALYNRVYGGDPVTQFMQQHPNGKVVATRETDHKLLAAVQGGADESDGAEYASSDEDTNKLTTQFRRLTVG